MRTQWGWIALTCLVACGGKTPKGGPNLANLTSIAIAQGTATVAISQGQSSSLTFVVTGTFDDGTTQDVSGEATFTIDDPALGTFAGATFTSTTSVVGHSTVRATIGDLSAVAGLTVALQHQIIDPTVAMPASPAPLFDGVASAARNPVLVYPNDGTLLPPNLGLVEIHFEPGNAANTLFEVRLANAYTDVRVYTRCGNPVATCLFHLPEVARQELVASNRGGEPLTLTVRGTDDAGTQVGTSSARSLAFALNDVDGSIYYLNLADGALWTITLAATEAVRPDLSAAVGSECVACHTFSRSGARLLASSSGALPFMVDVASSALTFPTGATNNTGFAAFSPDGSEYVTSAPTFGVNDLVLRSANDGQAIGNLNVGAPGSPAVSPDWSPDGKSVVFVSGADGTGSEQTLRGGLSVVMRGIPGDPFSPAMPLVSAQNGLNRFGPSFSPSGKLVAFSSSTCTPPNVTGPECNGITDPSATIHVVPSDASSAPFPLSKLNAPGTANGANTELASSYPKWHPQESQRTRAAGTRVAWIVFASSRAHGDFTAAQHVWMAAVDPALTEDGDDGSYAAFALPQQAPDESAILPTWRVTP